jgi:hypothetical protein
MYVPGIITGFLFTSFFWLAVIALLMWRFSIALRRKNKKAIIRNRARQAAIEDHRDNRRSERCVKAMDELGEAACAAFK